MLAIFMTTFREGLEALLIISVALAFLGKTGNRSLMTALFAGTGVAVLGSGALGIYLARHGAFSSVWEGWLALVACALIVGCIIHMQRHGKQMARQIREELAKATSRRPLLMWCSVFLFAVFMVGREGVEAATLIAALSGMETGRQLAIWATAGLGTAMMVAGLWSRYGQRINLSLLFLVTGVFLGLFAIQLGVYAFHEFSEAGVLPWLDNAYWHNATEAYGPGGEYGVWLTYALVLAPVTLLAEAAFSRRYVGMPEKSLS